MQLETKNSKKHHVRFFWRLIIAAALFNLPVAGVVGWTLQTSRQNYQDRAETSSQNIAPLLEQNISDSIEKIELNLHAADEEIARQMASGGIDDTALLFHDGQTNCAVSSELPVEG